MPTLPFFLFYSIFGFQRVGDLIWAAGDQRARGFLIGATSGRTTLNGEGLQHQDGHSHIAAYGYPHVIAYDPALGYEVAVIVEEGIRRMQQEGEPVIYYLTVTNASYEMPPMPEGAREGILKGMYRLRPTAHPRRKNKAHLFGSGAILVEVLEAQRMLEEEYGSPPTRGASPASSSSTRRGPTPSAGTCCTPARLRARPTCSSAWRARPAPSWWPPTT